jgi:methylglyoxal synthase
MEHIVLLADDKYINTLNAWIRSNENALSNFKLISGSVHDEAFINNLSRRFFDEELKMLIYFIDLIRAAGLFTVREATLANMVVALNVETADYILASRLMEL